MCVSPTSSFHTLSFNNFVVKWHNGKYMYIVYKRKSKFKSSKQFSNHKYINNLHDRKQNMHRSKINIKDG